MASHRGHGRSRCPGLPFREVRTRESFDDHDRGTPTMIKTHPISALALAASVAMALSGCGGSGGGSDSNSMPISEPTGGAHLRAHLRAHLLLRVQQAVRILQERLAATRVREIALRSWSGTTVRAVWAAYAVAKASPSITFLPARTPMDSGKSRPCREAVVGEVAAEVGEVRASRLRMIWTWKIA